jgi:hypothetical protein
MLVQRSALQLGIATTLWQLRLFFEPMLKEKVTMLTQARRRWT